MLYGPIDMVQKRIEPNSELNKMLLPYIAIRIRQLKISFTDNVLSEISTRLAKLIFHNIEESSEKLQIINDLPNDENASLLGSIMMVVYRHIQTLKEEGIIDITRRHTTVINFKTLI